MQSRFLPRSVAAGGQKARRKDRALRNLGVEELKQGGLLQPHAPLSLTPPAPLPHADPSQLHQAPLQQSACPRPCLRLQITLQIHKRPPSSQDKSLGGPLMQHLHSDGHPVVFPRQTLSSPFIPTSMVISPWFNGKSGLPISTPQFYLSQSPHHVRGEARSISLGLHHERTFRNVPTLIPHPSQGTQSCPLPTASGHFPIPVLPSR